MQILYERCAAVDAGKDVVAVAVRLPGGGPDGRQTVERTFKTFYGVLGEAARWLTSQGVGVTPTQIIPSERHWRPGRAAEQPRITNTACRDPTIARYGM